VVYFETFVKSWNFYDFNFHFAITLKFSLAFKEIRRKVIKDKNKLQTVGPS